jgi:hypothetical protein
VFIPVNSILKIQYILAILNNYMNMFE